MEALKKKIRVKKEDSAYVYFILESHEGITSYSTLPHHVGDLHRDLELTFSSDFASEVDEILEDLGEWVNEL
jgi:hypothetical protein